MSLYTLVMNPWAVDPFSLRGEVVMSLKKTAFIVPVLAAAVFIAVGLTAARPSLAAVGLVQGWNNIAYNGAAAPPAEALSSIEGDYDVVYRWDAEGKKYDVFSPGSPGFANTITTLNTDDAIWLNLTASTATLSAVGGGNVSISASTFLPASDLAIYEKSFNELYPVGTDAASQRHYANVAIPDGAVVTSMKMAFGPRAARCICVWITLQWATARTGGRCSNRLKHVHPRALLLRRAKPSPIPWTTRPTSIS